MKSKFRRKKHSREDMELQITSMADVFTILLVFLLKSYATSAVNISPNKDLELPVAQAGDTATESLKLEISSTAIQVEGKPISTLTAFAFDQKDAQSGGVSKELSQALSKERERQVLIAKNNSDVKVDPKILVIADQRTPYSTIKTVLASAAVNGYTDFKLVVVNPQ